MVGSSWKRAEIRGDAPMRVAGGNEHGVFRLRPSGGDVGCQVVRSPHASEGVGRGGDVAVEVVDGQDAESHLPEFRGVDFDDGRLLGRASRRQGCGEQQGDAQESFRYAKDPMVGCVAFPSPNSRDDFV